MSKIEVVFVEDGVPFEGMSTVCVTLKRDNDFVTCDGIAIWDGELVDDDLFDEWVSYAKNGEKGYEAVIVEGDKTVLYGLE